MSGLRIVVDGEPVAVDVSPTIWADQREVADVDRRALMDGWVREGTITDTDGVPLTGLTLQRVRGRMLGTYAHLPRPGESRRERQAQHWLLDGLWPWGTIPMLSGNPKAGKTTLVADLVASLLWWDHPFLGRFSLALTEEQNEHHRVWLINAESPAGDVERALVAAGVPEAELRDDDGAFVVDHLEELGSPAMLDLTEPENYDLWANRLVTCFDCTGADDFAPSVVIVDGLTAILAANGKGTEATGLWYAQFRRLMRELDVPNALVVAHATLQGGHAMGGVEAQAGSDGLWTYSSDNPDDPISPRRFSVRPRLGGVAIPRTRVVQGEDSRLLMQGSPPAKQAEPDTTPDDYTGQVIERLSAVGRAGLLTTEVTGSGREGKIRRDVLASLVQAGRVKHREEHEGRARSVRYWLTEYSDDL